MVYSKVFHLTRRSFMGAMRNRAEGHQQWSAYWSHTGTSVDSFPDLKVIQLSRLSSAAPDEVCRNNTSFSNHGGNYRSRFLANDGLSLKDSSEVKIVTVFFIIRFVFEIVVKISLYPINNKDISI